MILCEKQQGTHKGRVLLMERSNHVEVRRQRSKKTGNHAEVKDRPVVRKCNTGLLV
jgi:hypothetical protein